MRLVHARPHEFLVVRRRGRLRSLGAGASAILWPGGTAVTVPASKHEAAFGMTQASKDGIPLRFKGIAVVRVVDPVAAATAFDFAAGSGLERVGEVLAHVCLGELRDLVSQLTMRECVERRKTTLTDAVASAVARVVGGDGGDGAAPWGIAVELVQVAQVYIVDDDVRAKLEAELRHELAARAERAAITMGEQVDRARIHAEEEVTLARHASAGRVAQAALAQVRETHAAEVERVGLEQALVRERAERTAPVRRRALELERETAELALDAARHARDLRALEAEASTMTERVRLELEARILPLRQVPEIAGALSRALQGADLSIYGADHALAATLGPLVDRLARAVAPAASPADGRS